ncbi:hypothetical protein EVA_06903 [gut metagenome]|uniref:Uncharacterized protein n=1 Tax=gut metagenome TaxID=749906 RepID=J9GCB1_9ZZZZ
MPRKKSLPRKHTRLSASQPKRLLPRLPKRQNSPLRYSRRQTVLWLRCLVRRVKRSLKGRREAFAERW